MSFLSDMFFILPARIQEKLAEKFLDHNFRKNVKLDIRNMEVLNGLKAPVIFIANHLSNLDGVVLNRILRDFDPHFVAGQKLSGNKFTNIFLRMMKTINIKPNSADIESMREIVKTLRSGENIMIFPEGTRSRTGSMIDAKKGILLIAKLSGATIVPIAMMGTEKVMPINKDGKMERELLRKGTVRIIFGEPFRLTEKKSTESKEEYERSSLEDIMKRIAVNLDPQYRGVYSLNE